MADAEPLGVTDAVLAGFVRVVTHPRIFVDPTPTTTALEQASALRSASGVIVIASGAGYWDAFDRCCREGDARGNLVVDAAHAASAVETGARFVTFDRDDARA
ncbi:PIN domain-containing protein [Glaciibacter flavus]|uniref:PIN domain-containing protein n=1 Tax=Orlajensenia flava TaxID=2565934 RepID=UPI001A9B9751|nr:PIN domain-containing protein [Glaciibacter flavus]